MNECYAISQLLSHGWEIKIKEDGKFDNRNNAYKTTIINDKGISYSVRYCTTTIGLTVLADFIVSNIDNPNIEQGD